MLRLAKAYNGFNLSLFNLKNRYSKFLFEIEDSLEELFDTAEFVGGKYLNTFEEKFAKYHGYSGAKNAVGVSSGTDALILALRALNIGNGDEVLVPSFTFIASALAVTHVGATVKFVDVNPYTYNIDVEHMRASITRKTKAIIAVHLYGQPCDLTNLCKIAKENNLYIIEDCAQATGARWDGKLVGTFGDCGCFSFYPTKTLGGLGQGGAVISENIKLIEKVRMLGDVGRITKYKIGEVGYNSRLDSINALFLERGLVELDEWNNKRNKLAKLYRKGLKNLDDIVLPYVDKRAYHVYHLFVIGVPKEVRQDLVGYLASKHIDTGLYYPIPCHKQPVYNYSISLKVSEYLSESLLALPMDTYMHPEHVEYVTYHINRFFQ